ncbi:MAG: site-specific DNA-methyltransferase [Candidatus Micrarchaeia archaeon]|jgi:DNA modification methylase
MRSSLILGDCLKELKALEPESIDLVVADPPYSFHGGGGGFMAKKKIYDRIRKSFGSSFNPKRFLQEILRPQKKTNMFIYCNKALLPRYIEFAEKERLIWDCLIWHKPHPIPSVYNHFVNDIEYCVYIREKGVCFNRKLPLPYYLKVQTFNSPKFAGHPTPKPLDLMKRHVGLASRPGEIVLDPFMGSGTTGVAAVQAGRKFIGIEISPEFYMIAKKRIEDAEFQGNLENWVSKMPANSLSALGG